MTERGKAEISRVPDRFEIGPSALTWNNGEVVVDICEIGAPLPRRVRGRITVTTRTLFNRTFHLDESRRHRWRPIAPYARIQVEMEHPAIEWAGDAYFDHNDGDEPLENGFSYWDWSRTHRGSDTIIRYEAQTRGAGKSELSLLLAADGSIEKIHSPPSVCLPQSPIWRVPRRTRASEPAELKILQTLEDTPFYARSLLNIPYEGQRITGFHESLDLNRFSHPIVQAMLPFRMPRSTR